MTVLRMDRLAGLLLGVVLWGFASTTLADVLLPGAQHIGDTTNGAYTPNQPVPRLDYQSNPSRFSLSDALTVTAVRLEDTVLQGTWFGTPTFDVYIDDVLVGSGDGGSGDVTIDLSVPLDLDAGVHSISIDPQCIDAFLIITFYDACGSGSLQEADIGFSGLTLISTGTTEHLSFNRRYHLGDNTIGNDGYAGRVYPDAPDTQTLILPFSLGVDATLTAVRFFHVRDAGTEGATACAEPAGIYLDRTNRPAQIGVIDQNGNLVINPDLTINAGTQELIIEADRCDGRGANQNDDDISWDDIILEFATVMASNFEVSVAAAASTCVPHAVDITVLRSNGTVNQGYNGTVQISTSSGHGNWSVVTGAGTLDNGASDDGIALYRFAAGNGGDAGTVSLQLGNTHADNLTIRVEDTTDPTMWAVSTLVSFRDNAFVITPQTCTGASCAVPAGSAEVVAGRPHAFEAAVWRRDATSGDCAIATGYAGNQALKLWRNPDAQDPGGAAPTVGGVVVPTAVPAAANVTVAFTNGVGSFVLDTTDVGRYDLALRDDASGFAVDESGNPRPIEGGSPTLTVRPFALGYPAIAAGAVANPGGTATTGAGFVAAGDAFELTLGAYRWQAGDDADDNGLPDTGVDVTDNGITPAFAWDVQQTALLDTPATGTAGVLGGDVAVAAAGFAGGVVDASVSYNEVGSLRIDALATGYLGSGVAVTGQSPVIGRVYPADFELQGGSLTPACAGDFTYMDQPALGIAYTLAARNRAGQVTVNYAGEPADVGRPYNVGTVAFAAEDDDDGIDRAPRLFAAPGAAWAAGILDVADPVARFARLADPDGPFEALVIGLRVADPDGVVV
ncbi:MAG: hypothetical protein LPK58_00440, partial [Gammaproteobacteria bacterium]|nr:hypothetical protein [Gammaproteobacteria bacterium]